MAAELGANISVAKTAALLHDIGKAVDHEVQGPHDHWSRYRTTAWAIPRDCPRYRRAPQRRRASNGRGLPRSGGRRDFWRAPGGCRETLDLYIKRLEALETVATSFTGVQRAFAIQAGREVRVLVQPDAIDDLGSIHLARDVAKGSRKVCISRTNQGNGDSRDACRRLRQVRAYFLLTTSF